MKKTIYAIFMCIAFLFSGIVNAQVTTTSINGKVTSDEGVVLGATVQAVHKPSGTRYSAMTNEKGRYSIQGMRVGGPYEITITYVGYSPVEYENVQLALGDGTTYDANLKNSSKELKEIVVTATGTKSGGGAASNFKEKQITNTATVDRNIYDIAKTSPLVMPAKVGGVSIVGSNNRYNSFQIDGVVSNDVFGLAGSGTNGGQTSANPISLDAIQEVQVVVSPFDVRQGGFTGGGINAITKSGTNQFKGSVYGYYTDQNMYGRWNQLKEEKIKLDDESTKTVGFTLGGPIIKDKLFFFANAEYKYDTYQSDYYAGYTTGYISEAEAKAISDKFASITGFSEEYGSKSLETKSLSLLGRLDWNINEKNKFAFRYQLNDSYKDVYGPGSTTYYFTGSGYRMKNKTNSFVTELNSHISNSLYNEARLGATYVRDSRVVPYQSPNITIESVGGTYDATKASWTTGKTTAYIGTEYSSGANRLKQDIYTIEDNLSWYRGDHTFTFGTHNEIYKMYNLFIQASNGAYYYKSLNDFLKDSAYKFVYNYSDEDLTGTYQWAPTVKAGQFGLYAQDKWNVTNNLSLTYGLRIDIPTFFNKPTANDEFNASSYATTYGVKVGEVPSAKVMFSPRLGVRIFTDDTHKTLIRGGAGIFTGRVPFVWMVNNWGNTGMEMKGTTITTKVPSLTTYANDPVAAMNSAAGSASKPTINTVSKDFKFPQTFRANLALEQTLPFDVKLTLEGIYSKTMNNVWFENLALKDNGKKVFAVSADDANSATTYYGTDAGSYSSIINLKNTSKGYTYALSTKLEKSFRFGLDLMASYTYGHAYSVNDGTSSVALSNWRYNYAVDPNNKNEVSYSLFDVPNRVMAQVTYSSPKYLDGRLGSVISLTYNGYNGMRYCLTMNEATDFNGDTQKGNSLLYIPNADELAKMTFATEADRTSFGSWIEGDKYAKNHRGQYAERYSNSAPWENHIDLHFAEDFFYLKGKDSHVSLTLDIINFTNLLNKKWGTNYSSDYTVQPLKVTKMTANGDGNYIPTYSYQDDKVYKSDFFSRWHGQIGLKVTF